MGNPTSFPGDVLIAGDIRLNGILSPAIAKANILALALLQPFHVPLADCRVWDAMATLLPGTPAADDLGLVGGTWGAATPSLRSEDIKNLAGTKTSAV